MRAINLQGQQVQLPTTSGTAITVGDAQLVRVSHVSDTGYQILYVQNAAGTNTSSISLLATETVYINKDPSDKIWASDASGFATRVVLVY
jgi:hypothetical protein